jgi:putative transposase
MSSYRQILYHVILRTKDSKKTLVQMHSKELYAYILGIVKNKNNVLYRINGIEDHIHLLSDLHPSIALADYVKDIKVATSIWIKQNGKFPHFTGWADGYAALTYAWRYKEMIVKYIINQQEHHKNESFAEEYRRLLEEHGIKLDERFFLK